MKKIKDKVRYLLQKYPELRDDDFKLMATFYSFELGGWEDLKKLSAYDFFINFANHKYTSFESIRRMRCKLQEQMHDLRGKKYEERKILEQNVREEIKSL
jgi:hypothetical protein